MTELSVEELLMKLMWEAQNKKTQADDSSTARRWAIFNTDVEKILAFYKTYLVEGE